MSERDFENKYNEVNNYFKKVIKGYLVNDIKLLLNSDFDDKEFGGCAAPLAMTVFSAMNQLGYLTSDKTSERLHHEKDVYKETDTDLCIKEYCNRWMKKIDIVYKKSTIQDMFTNLFRNGFAHQFISVYPSAITRSSKLKELISFSDDDSPILQVSILAQNFLDSIDYLEKKIQSTHSTNHDFIEHFYDRFHHQKNKYLQKNSELFNKIARNKKQIGGNTSTTETTRYPEVTKSIE